MRLKQFRYSRIKKTKEVLLVKSLKEFLFITVQSLLSIISVWNKSSTSYLQQHCPMEIHHTFQMMYYEGKACTLVMN